MISDGRRADLGEADDALVRLRRLWSPEHARVIDHDGQRIEMSSVLVVEVCARAGAPEGLSIAEIARQLDIEASTASRLVDRAVRAELVERARAATNARRAVVQLTASGRALRESAVAFRLAWLGDLLAEWSDDDIGTFATLLQRFADAVSEARPPGPRS